MVAAIELPVGFHRFHGNSFINYQINRIHSEGFTRIEDLHAAAADIEGFEDYVRVFTEHADRAENDGRLANAAFYVRAAEFFTPPRSEHKRSTYRRFIDLFDRAFAGHSLQRHHVPYAGNVLPATCLRGRGNARGTVVLFGGFDSLIEEFFAVWVGLAQAGFDVVAVDGPGQGGARTLYGQVFDHDWEKPVAAVLDHLQLEEVALVGMSMGGYWALRAAAFEPRVTRVVAWPPVYDWLAQLPRFVRPIVRGLPRWPRFLRASIRLRMKLAPILRHVVSQGLYIQGDGSDPVEVVTWLLAMNAEHLQSHRVRQDVLLMGGERDRFQPPTLMSAQAEALVSARSLSTRMFTRAEGGEHHCQIGNLGLAIEHLTGWLVDHSPVRTTESTTEA